MKKLLTLASVVAMSLTLSACQDYAANTGVCDPTKICTECTNEETPSADNVYYVNHIAGHGTETVSPVNVLFEFQTLKYTKYQIAFTSCTWRPAQKNYKQVAYVELNKDGSIRFISFDVDSDGDYTPAVWGDSSPIPPYGDESKRSTGKTKEDFMTDFINGYLVGKTVEELANISTIDDMDFNNIDTYAGSSVSVNNIFRAIQGLQK